MSNRGPPRDSDDQQQMKADNVRTCPKCGAIVEDHLDHCQDCGRKVRRDRRLQESDTYERLTGGNEGRRLSEGFGMIDRD
jgi:ribosomal protein S27AE